MKLHLLAAAGVVLAAPAAIAGPYVNTEFKSSWTGSDYSKSTWYNDLGFDTKLGKSTKFYLQGGPAIVMPDGGDNSVELHVKTGLKMKLTPSLGAYAEVAALTQDEINFDEDLKLGTKIGLKYYF